MRFKARSRDSRAVIAIDARMPPDCGIGTYLLCAAHGAMDLPDARLRLILAPGGGSAWAGTGVAAEESICAQRIYTLGEQAAVAYHARGAALLHVPHYNIPLLYRRPMVSTIHDVIHLTDAGGANSGARTYASLMLRAALRRSRRVVTVSRYSRDEIVRVLGADPGKLRVIYNGFNPARVAGDRSLACASVRTKWAIGGPFILYVGNSKPHKNLGALGDAFFRIAAERGDLKLVLALGGAPEPEWAKAQPRVRVLPRLADSDLASLYGSAEMLVAPSLCEGFGYPVVEAMASGTPVVCASAGALPEVAADAAEYFRPREPEALAAAIRRLFEEPNRRAGLREAGRRRASACFAWSRCAAEHGQLYAEVLDESKVCARRGRGPDGAA